MTSRRRRRTRRRLPSREHFLLTFDAQLVASDYELVSQDGKGTASRTGERPTEKK
ncbi:hypothetical protein QND27_004121 [Salmonella enterica]|nr:hypothetical protein [Salmonella enterica]